LTEIHFVYAILSEDACRLFCMDRGWELGQWQAWCLTSLQTTLADPPGAAAGSRLDVVQPPWQPPAPVRPR
jgi:hypothetical protein